MDGTVPIVQDCGVGTPVEPFVAHCAELLVSVGAVRVRRMFGGWGLYVDDLFVALVFDDRLFLKADALTAAAFDEAGSVAFEYRSAGRDVSLGYRSAPPGAMESPDQMRDWAERAVAAALRSRARRAPKPSEPARPSRRKPLTPRRAR
jgi:DNA transformation protein